MSDVIVVGAGPSGLMLAAELALAGVEVEILERRTTQELLGTRARGFHSRTIELLDQRGLADRFLAAGQTVPAMSFAGTALEVGHLPSRHAYTLALGQSPIERLLLDRVEELGVPVRRGLEVTGFDQDDTGVDVHLAEGRPRRAAYLVGADGGRSVVRGAAGIDFVGPDATRSHLIAEVEVTEETPTGLRLDDVGIHAMNVLENGHTVGLVVTEQRAGPASEPTMAELREALTAVFGTDFGVHSPTWISRFTDATRQAAAYRRGRVLIAGDAAHTHPPTGGQGIGLGVQDAVNLGWKLAQVVHGVSSETLLESYHAERHPATARVLKNVMTQALLQRGDARTAAVRDTFTEVLGFEEPRTLLAGLQSGLDVRYDLGEGHPLLGRRMPDLDLTTDDGPCRVFELLHDARPLLLDLGAPGGLDLAGWADRVRLVAATTPGPWEMPVVGAITAPAAVLIRPDGHAAWVGDGSPAGLPEALGTWFGPG
jgi:2-polyprenyl-6-methoxyphenol hydroxylase-like FAD-dependent oxidoreductase